MEKKREGEEGWRGVLYYRTVRAELVKVKTDTEIFIL